MAEPDVEFLCDPALYGTIPEPGRAIRFAPDWFKRLEREMGMPDALGMPGLTVKACLPVTDAFALGFVIPLPFDVMLHVPEDRVSIRMGWPDDVRQYDGIAKLIKHHYPNETVRIVHRSPERLKAKAGLMRSLEAEKIALGEPYFLE